MAMSGGIYRRALWLSCLFCTLFLVATADAATRKFVKLPSKSVTSQNPSLPPTRTGDSLEVAGQALEGELLDPEFGTKGTPIKVLPRLDGSLSRMFNNMKTGMKGGVIGMAGSVGLALLLDQIDAVIDDAGTITKTSLIPTTNLSMYWCMNSVITNCNKNSSSYLQKHYATPTSAIFDYLSQSNLGFCSYSVVSSTATYNHYRVIYSNASKGCSAGMTSNIHMHRHGSCPSGSTYSEEQKQCLAPGGQVPLDDSDFDLMFDHASQQNADWLTGLLNDYCKGSIAPERCFSDMWDQSPLSGPATVKGPSKTSTTTSVGADGLASETVVTTTTNFDITYGDNYYDYRKSVITTTEVDGVKESETTETEPEEVEQEEKPQEEKEQEEPSPCQGTNCDGPAYQDQYEKTTETKESSIDDYMGRVQQIPILTAIGGMFDISVSGTCPVWELHHAMPVMGAVMNIDLVFDYLCLPWFVVYGPWIRAVIYALAAFAAVRVGLL